MKSGFSGLERGGRLLEMEQNEFDVLVIGGGITGAGVALDAQTRGLKTALLDMQDFAAGTSSRSTKLVHGGLRYLKQLEIKMVAEVGKERAIVYENGPHVTTPEWMLLPLYKGGTFGSLSTSLGLRVYDWLAGVKRSERRRMLSREEAARKEPLLKTDGLLGGGYYVEYRTDDARLTIEVLKKAASEGAAIVNYAKVEGFVYEEGRLVGVRARDMIGGAARTIRARQVVNAAGPWVDELRELDRSRHGKTLRLTKGVHLVFDGGRFPLRQAIYFDSHDRRMIFAIPRDGKTYVGTTDTDYTGDTAKPDVTGDDNDYLLAACNAMFPGLKLVAADVESSWAGLRPLIYEEGKAPSEVSRRDELFVAPSGLLTIAGGKLTGYRKMAETVTDLLIRQLQVDGRTPSVLGQCATRTMPISGGDVGRAGGFSVFVEQLTKSGMEMGLPEQSAARLAAQYGSNAPKLYERMLAARKQAPAMRHGLDEEMYARLLYSLEEEMVVKPVDFFIRRTGALFFDISSVQRWKQQVLAVMSERIGYSETQAVEYAEQLEMELRAARGAL